MSPLLRGCLVTLLLVGPARDARADWLLTPFVGTTFAGQTTIVQLDTSAGAAGPISARHLILGGAAGWLSDNVLGFETDFAFVPGIFVKDNPDNLVTSNSAAALSGNVIAAVPLSVTRESLRPYLVGGFGLLHGVQKDRLGLLDEVSLNEPAVQIGGGALGLVTERAGVRFDLRQLRTLSRDDTLRGDRRTKLSFWRATIGVVIRY